MRFGVVVIKFCLVAIAAFLLIAAASAQQAPFFPDCQGQSTPCGFSSSLVATKFLQMNGSHLAPWNDQTVLRLTEGNLSPNSHQEGATSWFTIPQQVNQGFTTYFAFQIHSANCCNPGDGLAFVVQNSSHTDRSYGAIGAGITAWGVSEGGMGYAGIPNSLAVEFDTFTNVWDPSSNHVAVQGCGTNTNGPVHIPGTFTIGSNTHVASCLVARPTPPGCPSPGINSYGINCNIPTLGVTCGPSSCADGMVHQVAIEYTPPASVNSSGTLMVWIDQPFIPNTHIPCPNNKIPGCPVAAVTSINIPYNIDNTHSSTGISLAGGTSAWVGFTGSQTKVTQAEDILAWEFTSHAATQVQQQPIQGCPATNPSCTPPPTVFSFGANDTQVQFYPGFQNPPPGSSDPFLMTVSAMLVPQRTFHSRLQPGPFDAEQCVIYGGTGGNCIVYTITCQRQSNPMVTVPCPQITSPPGPKCVFGTPGCIQFTTGVQPLSPVTSTNADYLKAPIGTNMWQSIFDFYDPNAIDGRGGGTGGTTSDFVLTFNPNKP